MKKVKFKGIDGWNRPIFKEIRKDKKQVYYGRTFGLFDMDATEEEILSKVKSEDLEYFGRSFGCEPMGGGDEDIEIIK
uniref:Uncharacterized protein n=1 Tax=viral metagenome TaxID=1070528 RepID=A0A6H1ZSK1_9ZZZZ